jgi:hypothetical protein
MGADSTRADVDDEEAPERPLRLIEGHAVQFNEYRY